MARFDLIVTVSRPDGEPLEERVDAPAPFVIAPEPLPAGWDCLVAGRWLPDGRVQVVAGDGRGQVLGPDARATLSVDEWTVVLQVVPRIMLRRTSALAWSASALWFAVVVSLQNTASQADLLWEKRCPWFGGIVDAAPVPEAYEVQKATLRLLLCPVAHGSTGDSGIDAEYIARLLRKDYDGVENGAPPRTPPPEGMKEGGKTPYLPAGTLGDPKVTGGSADPTGEVVRSTSGDAEKQQKRRSAAKPELLGVQQPGAPLAVPGPEAPDDAVGPVDGEGVADANSAEPAPSERREGWGFRDWRDLVPDRKDRVEIREEQGQARERLKIDPEDFEAMQTLAYYQYLEGDFEGSAATYDEMIERFPDSGAVINNKALIYKRLGQYDKEEGMYRLALALDPADPTPMVNLALNLAHQRRFDEAFRWMDRADRLDDTDPYHELHRAKIHAAKGEREAALRWLDLAMQRSAVLDILHHIEFRQDIRVDPAFETLRQDAEFRAILRKYYGDDSPVKDP